MVQHISDQVMVAGQAVDRTTVNGLKAASARSGVSFQYLLAKAAQESSLKSDAQAPDSSATGLFQFTRGTWLEMMKRYGAQFGYGDLAAKILQGSDGKAKVADGAETRILALREDPEASALMAAQYAKDNASALHESLGRGVDAPDLYLAHFLGATGAGLLLAARNDDPDRTAASLMPAAAKANRSVFYTAGGRARTAEEVVDLVRARFGAQLDRFAGAKTSASEPVVQALAAPSPAVAAVLKTQGAKGPMINPADLKSGLTSGQPEKMMASFYVMEELARLIALKPMMMNDGENDTGLSSGGFQGSDWTSALTSTLGKDMPANAASGAAPGASQPANPAATQASRAYGAIKGHVAALFGQRRNKVL